MWLGIETSCDETAAAIVAPDGRILSNIIHSQIAEHQRYGGVVPEIASRCHVEALPGVVNMALHQANVAWNDITAIAVTRGPGLATSLLTGVVYARGLATRLSVPLIGVNHLVGHLHSIWLRGDASAMEPVYPHLVLLVSGGHTCLLRRDGPQAWTVLGQTLDDAAGEALDKGARLLGLGYPGGPEIQRLAMAGDPAAIDFPRGNPPKSSGGWNYPFSFSGLKTALLYHVKKNPDDVSPERLPHVAASYQEAVVDTLTRRVGQALATGGIKLIGCAGGVARNQRLREKLTAVGARAGIPVMFADPAWCADNAAMIAAAAKDCYAGLDPASDVVPNLRVESL
jgi:N6-L-threonylcarbamoyladenine synthase